MQKTAMHAENTYSETQKMYYTQKTLCTQEIRAEDTDNVVHAYKYAKVVHAEKYANRKRS